MNLTKTGFGGVDWIRLAQDKEQWRAVLSEVMNVLVLRHRVSLESLKLLTSLFTN
jgi:hypothetical protein